MITNKDFHIMGIVNITPDSFSDGGLYFDNVDFAVKSALEMVDQGASIIDIGGESTRPGSESVDAAEEISRVLPVVQRLCEVLPKQILISVDTNKFDVASKLSREGINILNILGGLKEDGQMARLISETSMQAVIYHIKGVPRTMQSGVIDYPEGVVNEVDRFFEDQIKLARKFGIEKNLILDPGIGFGKSLEQNLDLIKQFETFTQHNLPTLLGVSRKSHLGLLLQQELGLKEAPGTNDRLEGALAETAVAMSKGVNIIRTHDVQATTKFCRVLRRLF